MDDFEILKEKVKNETRRCIISDHKSPESCLDEAIGMAVDRYGIDSETENKLREKLGDNR